MLTLLELKKFLITKLFQTLLSRLYMQKLLKKKRKKAEVEIHPLLFCRHYLYLCWCLFQRRE